MNIYFQYALLLAALVLQSCGNKTDSTTSGGGDIMVFDEDGKLISLDIAEKQVFFFYDSNCEECVSELILYNNLQQSEFPNFNLIMAIVDFENTVSSNYRNDLGNYILHPESIKGLMKRFRIEQLPQAVKVDKNFSVIQRNESLIEII